MRIQKAAPLSAIASVSITTFDFHSLTTKFATIIIPLVCKTFVLGQEDITVSKALINSSKKPRASYYKA